MNKIQQTQLSIIIVAIAILAIFSASFPFGTIPEEETDIFLVDWDNWYEDTISGENDYMAWGQITGPYNHDCTIELGTGWSGNKILDFGNAGRESGQGGDARINLKPGVINEDDYNTWCFGLYYSCSFPWGSSTSDFTISMYNSADLMVHGLRVHAIWDTQRVYFQVYGNDEWHDIGYFQAPAYGTASGLVWLNTTYVGGVTFNTSAFSSAYGGYLGNYSGAWDGTPNEWVSSSNNQWEYVTFVLSTTNDAWGPILSVDLDDIIISDDIKSTWGFIYRNPFDPLKVTCYQCQNNNLVSDEFNNSCPDGWYLENELPNSNCSTPATCGNGLVDPLETCLNCPQDVGACGSSVVDKIIMNWWVLLGLILSGLASVYMLTKKKLKWRVIVYILFIGFLIYFIYLFM